jgi:hypothetical protein
VKTPKKRKPRHLRYTAPKVDPLRAPVTDARDADERTGEAIVRLYRAVLPKLRRRKS